LSHILREDIGGVRLHVAPELRDWAVSALARAGRLAAAAALEHDARPLRGRGRVWDVPTPAGRVVVRPYLRGGFLAPLARDRYLLLGRPRPERELFLGLEARARGIPTPEPLAAVVYPRAATYAGELVTRLVPGAPDMAELLFAGELGPAERLRLCRAAGAFLRRLHDAGLRHPDLNLKNLLCRFDGGQWALHVLDLDRARLGAPVPAAARRRMVRRFFRSLAKWERRTGRQTTQGERHEVLVGYAETGAGAAAGTSAAGGSLPYPGAGT
jgi:3-deoxy-D-manno-octulosonic acid kinase